MTTDADDDLLRGEVVRLLNADGGTAAPPDKALLEETYDRALWARLCEAGYLGVLVPEAAGGLGLSFAEACQVAEEIGAVVGAVPFTPTACTLAAIARYAEPAEAERWIGKAMDVGTIATAAVFEAGDGGLPARFATTFANGRVSGAKTLVLAGAFADVAVVSCADRSGAPALALVDLNGPGVTRRLSASLEKRRGYADIAFDKAPATRLSAPASDDLLLDLALMTAFEQVGGSRACQATSKAYALERRAFGQPIGAFQSIKHLLADLYVELEIARGAALSALDATAAERGLAVAAARLAATRAYDASAQENIQIHGAAAVITEAPHHLHYRRARCLGLEWGGAAMWRTRLLDAVTRRNAA